MSENKSICDQERAMKTAIDETGTLSKLIYFVKKFKEDYGREPRIYYFGSSFNPLHNGHIGIIIHGVCNFDLVVLAPVAQHAFVTKSSMLSYENRCEILKQWIDTSGHGDKIMISFLDKELLDTTGKSSYSIDIIGNIVQNIPEIDLYWAAGADTVCDFLEKKWKGGHSLADFLRFIVFQREGCIRLEIPEHLIGRFILVSESFGNFSSTAIRNLCSEEFETVKERLGEMLPDSILEIVYECYSPPDLGKRKSTA